MKSCMLQSRHTVLANEMCMLQSRHTVLADEICMLRPRHTVLADEISINQSRHTVLVNENCMPRLLNAKMDTLLNSHTFRKISWLINI